ncbi:MAG TPA: DUF2851 family protein [Opitutaceae bacterium]|nr:DUF2851 family protein [Opitutaceae bacterium]
MREDTGAAAVAELQGLDGSFSFAERLLQRIWERGEFDRTRAVTADGRAIRILNPGLWNSRGGPDFRQARLEIGGVRVSGDVELHLRAADWTAHGHAADANYDGVVLHVVLFPAANVFTEGAHGRNIPVLSLLSLLYRSLEEYADDEAVERLANHPLARAQETLLKLTRADQLLELRRGAAERWATKVSFAARRAERLGWTEACHQTALEILGYRFNRCPMLALAMEHPLTDWPEIGSGDRLTRLEAEFADRWNRQAVRPANHPRTRIRQYALWTERVRNWPDRLARYGVEFAGCADGATETAEFRKRCALADLWSRLAEDVCGGAVGGTRFRTLVCDGFLPLLAAREPARSADFRLYWFHGYAGDIPENISRILSALQLTSGAKNPLNHGLAQGLLSWCWRDEMRKQQTTACP